MTDVYIVTEADELDDHDYTLGVYSTCQLAMASVPTVEFWHHHESGFTPEDWFAAVEDEDGMRTYYTIRPYLLDNGATDES